jgi:two-component system NtrC family sensor kinase
MHKNTKIPDPVRILLIDDSSTNNLLFRSIFEETGYQVMVEEDPLNAMEALYALKPDLVLLDLMLPGIDGLELLHQIKTDQSSRDIPVLMYTAHHSAKAQKQAIAMGAAGYLLKPVSPGEILDKVSRILS